MRTTIQRQCAFCGQPFLATASQIRAGRGKVCSKECQYAMLRETQSHHLKAKCARCGKEFKTTAYKLATFKELFCSWECRKQPLVTTTCRTCGKSFQHSIAVSRSYCSKECANAAPSKSLLSRIKATEQWANPDTRKKLLDGIVTRSQSEQWLSSPHFQKGEAHPRYTGGRRERNSAMSQYKYKFWRTSVFKRDNYTCQDCGIRGGELVVHHIEHWAKSPELRYEISNGITLCKACHSKRHGWKS